jgi:NAD-dependent dihydropyrimidine dehydrogenase PreA subunit
MAEAAIETDARLVLFDGATWKRLDGTDYFLAPPVLEADLVINLPKLKTHVFTLYTGAVKNLFGAIPGMRKREYHCRAPGMVDFGQVLVDVLELVRPGLTIMDGVLGQEGDGPGVRGTPRWYSCLAAATDPVALDAVIAQALGYRSGEVVYLAQASARGVGVSDLQTIQVQGDRSALAFGAVRLPRSHWYFRVPSWVSRPVLPFLQLHPRLIPSACIGCGRCAEACPNQVITSGRPPTFDLDHCIGCLCCVEVCPQGAIAPRRNLIARIIGMGR